MPRKMAVVSTVSLWYLIGYHRDTVGSASRAGGVDDRTGRIVRPPGGFLHRQRLVIAREDLDRQRDVGARLIEQADVAPDVEAALSRIPPAQQRVLHQVAFHGRIGVVE